MAYAISAQVWVHAVSLAPHDVYLAYSLLQRRVDLIQLPPTTYDLLPFAAIFGVGFSAVLFSVVLGTSFWYLASLGTYWFTSHIVAVFSALLATREALTRQRWFLAGLWLACAGFARPTALFLAPFFLIIMFYGTRSSASPASGMRQVLLVTRYALYSFSALPWLSALERT